MEQSKKWLWITPLLCFINGANAMYWLIGWINAASTPVGEGPGHEFIPYFQITLGFVLVLTAATFVQRIIVKLVALFFALILLFFGPIVHYLL